MVVSDVEGAKFVFVTSPICEKHVMGFSHPESPERIREIMEAVNKLLETKSGEVAVLECKEADLADVERVHDSDHVELVRRISEQGGGSLGPDNDLNSFTYQAALVAAGGAISAAQLVLERECGKDGFGSFAIIRPPGHHASRDMARGFCFFNNMAITATKLLQEHLVGKVAIVDIDNHFGDGTSEIFYDSRDVLYVSLHAHPSFAYPGKGFLAEIGKDEGEGYNVNIPLFPGTGDQEYLEAFDRVVIPILEAFKPDIILVLAGFDGMYTDPIGSLALTPTGYEEVAKKLYATARKVSSGKLSLMLEGGYDLDNMPKCVVSFVTPVLDPSVIEVEKPVKAGSRLEQTRKTIENLKDILSPFWPL